MRSLRLASGVACSPLSHRQGRRRLTTLEGVVAVTAGEAVASAASVETVVASVTADLIVAAEREQAVASGGSGDRVVPVRADRRIRAAPFRQGGDGGSARIPAAVSVAIGLVRVCHG